MGNLEQSAQVETTLNNLEYMDFSGDPEEGNQRLLEEIKNLRMARHRLRDKQEAAFLAIARCENRIDKIEKQLFIDPLTKLRNRIGLEVELSRVVEARAAENAAHVGRCCSMSINSASSTSNTARCWAIGFCFKSGRS